MQVEVEDTDDHESKDCGHLDVRWRSYDGQFYDQSDDDDKDGDGGD